MADDPTARPTLEWLERPVTELPGVSTRTASALGDLGVATIHDLLEHYPTQGRYKDLGAAVPIGDAAEGDAITLIGFLEDWKVIRAKQRRMVIARAMIRDVEGTAVEVPFFNQQYLVSRFPRGTQVSVSGTVSRFRSTLQLKAAKHLTAIDDVGDEPDAARITPTYPASGALSSGRIAALVELTVEALVRRGGIPEHLPDELRATHGLMGLTDALAAIHTPDDLEAPKPARRRLVYDELLCLQLGLAQRRHHLADSAAGIAAPPLDDGLAGRLLRELPFPPTSAQMRAIGGLGADLAEERPMHRLLQGDVGAGKTIVAAWALLNAVDHGRQGVLMAPTEVLAEQHLRTLDALLAPLGANLPGGPRIELVTGSIPTGRLRGLLAQVAAGDIDILIGTHALLEDRVAPPDLGVVVVDEQHRFGVEHRARLRDKRTDGRTPDVLVMTATPIPRSLALTLYGDLDVTVLDELPPGRQPIETQVIDRASPRRAKVEAFVRSRAEAGERTFWVCPTIEDSEALDVASATTTHAELSARLGDVGVGLVHGRLPATERDEVMASFREGRIAVLVATTVIEVGVDVPAATIMVIEDADRFGISQLHQLRGRIGRGRVTADQRNFCVLFGRDPDHNERLAALAATTDGFELAEVDLALRGEGSLFDTRQSGLPDLKLASLDKDMAVVEATQADARRLVAEDPELAALPALAAEVARRYGAARLADLKTG